MVVVVVVAVVVWGRDHALRGLSCRGVNVIKDADACGGCCACLRDWYTHPVVGTSFGVHGWWWHRRVGVCGVKGLVQWTRSSWLFTHSSWFPSMCTDVPGLPY